MPYKNPCAPLDAARTTTERIVERGIATALGDRPSDVAAHRILMGPLLRHSSVAPQEGERDDEPHNEVLVHDALSCASNDPFYLFALNAPVLYLGRSQRFCATGISPRDRRRRSRRLVKPNTSGMVFYRKVDGSKLQTSRIGTTRSACLRLLESSPSCRARDLHSTAIPVRA